MYSQQRFSRICGISVTAAFSFRLWLSEPVISSMIFYRFFCPLKPTGAYLLLRIKLGYIRLDIQKRRPIEHVNISDIQGAVSYIVQLND